MCLRGSASHAATRIPRGSIPGTETGGHGIRGYLEGRYCEVVPALAAALARRIACGADAGRGRYAPPRVKSVTKSVVCGEPDVEKIGTSRIERSNWTVRTMQRRFTRLAAGFSRKLENLRAACALHFAYWVADQPFSQIGVNIFGPRLYCLFLFRVQ